MSTRLEPIRGAARALFLSTVAFGISFAVWGLLSGLAPVLKQQYHLTSLQVSLMIAIPVLMGSVGRLPMGLLADRYGAKPVMVALLLSLVVPTTALAHVHGYANLVIWAFFLGIGGTSFSIGIAFASPWFPAEKQGTALGIFGAGNIGQSIAVFFGPVLAARYGHGTPFLVFGWLAFAWGIVIVFAAQSPPQPRPRLTFAEALRPMRTEPLLWLFSLLYFVTFGGFVALGIYLPTLLKEVFHLTPTDAGARTAGFVVLATVVRPIGGWLSDRISGERVLSGAFGALVFLAIGLGSAAMPIFTVAALSLAVCLGLGNGAVFKLVPRYFPGQMGTATGLIGMFGGLGGFFPPLVLGILRDRLRSYTPGFVLLSLFGALCWTLNHRLLIARKAGSG